MFYWIDLSLMQLTRAGAIADFCDFFQSNYQFDDLIIFPFNLLHCLELHSLCFQWACNGWLVMNDVTKLWSKLHITLAKEIVQNINFATFLPIFCLRRMCDMCGMMMGVNDYLLRTATFLSSHIPPPPPPLGDTKCPNITKIVFVHPLHTHFKWSFWPLKF